jgi:hypothetical protein
MSKSGLWVDGSSIGRNDAQLLSVLKFALVPKDSWALAAFKSDDIPAIFELADPFAIDVVSAMINDYLTHEFESPAELARNIALRKGVVAAMEALCSGVVDGDYTEAAVGVPPALGYLENLEVLWAPGSATGEGVLTSPLPYEAPDAAWDHMATTSPWSGNIFLQKADVALSDALNAITPFRGECAGALQLSILLGAKSALGAQALDTLSEGYGRVAIGAWRLPEGEGKKTEKTFASRFLTQVHDLPANYTRGGVLGVPGDYLYFKNKDDYPDLAPTGGWQGENCIYMGKDALGGPHYSGMGLAWKTEFALRMFLSNAYLNDANAAFLAAKRAGKAPTDPINIIEDEQTQVRFTARAVLRSPEAHVGEALYFETPSDIPAPLSDQDIHDALIALGGNILSEENIVVRDVSLGAFITALKVPEANLQQRSGAGMSTLDLSLVIGAWAFVIQSTVPHLSIEDQVIIRAHKKDV